MRNDFEYISETSKKWLATIASYPLYRLRRLEILLYVSLTANIVAVACLLAMMILGR